VVDAEHNRQQSDGIYDAVPAGLERPVRLLVVAMPTTGLSSDLPAIDP
jgi:hypothetical protein